MPLMSFMSKWRLLAQFSGLQLLNQFVAFISGIVIIRYLAIAEYGIYTICITCLGVLTVLSDGGVGSAILSIGGPSIDDKKKIGSLIHAAGYVMRILGISLTLIGIPILAYFLRAISVGWLDVGIISLIVTVSVFVSIKSSILLSIFRLNQKINYIQIIDLVSGLIRLVAICLLAYVIPSASMMLLVACLCSIVVLIIYEVKVKEFILASESSLQERQQIWKFVKDLLPAGIYWCLSNNIAAWILGLKGNAKDLGQIGGLGRISQLYVVLNAVIVNYVVPRFAKTQNPQALMRNFIAIALGLPFLLGSLILFVMVGGDWLLLILGESFSTLKYELILSLLVTSLTLYGGALFQMCAARGWRLNAFNSIIPNLVVLVAAIWYIETNTLQGVLLVSVVSSLPNVFLFLGLGLIKSRSSHANSR